MGKTIQPLWRSVAAQKRMDGRNMKNHSHLTVARHVREKIHPSVLVVTIRGGEEKGICSAALRELLRIVKDQIGENSEVAMVLSRGINNLEKSECEDLAKSEI